jgi:hypothetical protein
MRKESRIKYGNYGNCGGIDGSVQFKGIGTVIIPVPGSNSETVNLHLTNVKYCRTCQFWSVSGGRKDEV